VPIYALKFDFGAIDIFDEEDGKRVSSSNDPEEPFRARLGMPKGPWSIDS
jgi:hypothetical protein